MFVIAVMQSDFLLHFLICSFLRSIISNGNMFYLHFLSFSALFLLPVAAAARSLRPLTALNGGERRWKR